MRSFPFDTIKIDSSFVCDLPQRSDCAANVEAAVGLARRLDMRSIAEGIETSAQLAAVESSGCDEVQGYQFNHPMPAAELRKLLQKHG